MAQTLEHVENFKHGVDPNMRGGVHRVENINGISIGHFSLYVSCLGMLGITL